MLVGMEPDLGGGPEPLEPLVAPAASYVSTELQHC